MFDIWLFQSRCDFRDRASNQSSIKPLAESFSIPCTKAVCMALICRKFDSIAESDQSIPASGLAPKRMNKRTVSAPNFSIINSGLTVLPRLLLIFADLDVNASPQVGHEVSLRSTCSSTLQDAQYGVGALTIP